MSEGPTASRHTNLLLQLAQQWEQGQSDGTEFEACLGQRIQGMEQVHEDFLKRAESLGQDFLDAHDAEIEAVLGHFAGYESTLGEMLSAFSRQDRPAMGLAWQRLARQTDPLLEAMKDYATLYLHFGSSPFPLVNLLTQLGPALECGEIGPAEMESLVDEVVQHFAQAQQQLHTANLLQEPGWREKGAAIRQAQQALDILGQRLSQGLSADRQQVDQVASAMERIQQADEAIYQAEFLNRPTAIPALNLLLNSARGVLHHGFPVHDLRAAFDWYQAYSDEMERDFEEAVAGPTKSSLLLEELPKSRLALDMLFEAVEKLGAELDQPEPARVEPILARIEKAAARLQASQQVFETAAEREGKQLCPFCCHPNSGQSRVCDKCMAQLPRIDPEMLAGSTFVLEEHELEDESAVPEKVALLLEACGKFHDQTMGVDEFRQVIEWSRAQMLHSQEHMNSGAELLGGEPDEAAERLLEESLELFQQALDEWEEGLESILAYAEAREFGALEQGIAKIWSASRKLTKVHRIGELAEQTTAEKPAPCDKE